MRPKSLWQRILYKYEYIGQVEKNGQIYKKYKKSRRFRVLKKSFKSLLYIALFLAVIFLIDFLRNVMGGKFRR